MFHVPGEAGGGILRAGGQELLSAVQVSRSDNTIRGHVRTGTFSKDFFSQRAVN